MPISNTRLTTTGNTTVYSSAGNNAVTTIIACNTLSPSTSLTDEITNSCNLTLYLVPNPATVPGAAANDTTTIVKELNIPAGETVFFSDEKIILSNGDTVVATASVASRLSITVSTLPV